MKASPVAWASFMEEAGMISKLQFLIKNYILFSADIFLQFLANKTLDPDLQLEKMLDPCLH